MEECDQLALRVRHQLVEGSQASPPSSPQPPYQPQAGLIDTNIRTEFLAFIAQQIVVKNEETPDPLKPQVRPLSRFINKWLDEQTLVVVAPTSGDTEPGNLHRSPMAMDPIQQVF